MMLCRVASTNVHFRIGRDDIEVAFQVALEFAERALEPLPTPRGNSVAEIIRAGASRPIKLPTDERAALGRAIDGWAAEGASVWRLRKRLA